MRSARPGLEQWDLAANKNFRIREGIRLQFRSEFFNVTEPHQLRNPEHDHHHRRRSAPIRTTYPARQIQFALKLIF